MEVIDFTHSYEGKDKAPSLCHVRVIHAEQRPVCVICSEHPENPGSIVSRSSMPLYREVSEELRVRGILNEREKICFWVEHIPEMDGRKETFDILTFLSWPDGRLEISRRAGEIQAIADATGYPPSSFRVDLSECLSKEAASK